MRVPSFLWIAIIFTFNGKAADECFTIFCIFVMESLFVYICMYLLLLLYIMYYGVRFIVHASSKLKGMCLPSCTEWSKISDTGLNAHYSLKEQV